MERMYFDHAATTPLHPEAAEAMIAVMRDVYGNASSVHAAGREAAAALTKARDGIAERLGCRPQELVFTSGGTESDNTALIGAVHAAWRKHGRERPPHVVTTEVEHHAVLHTCHYLEQFGVEVTYVAPDDTGLVAPERIQEALRPNTCLVSVMTGNNEVGTLQPIREIGQMVREQGIVMHTDAVQALGLLPFQLKDWPVDMASFSAHKMNGPKGVGCLYIRQGTDWEPMLYGGNQERKRRAGTENVAGIAGFAAALRVTEDEREDKVRQIRQVRAALWSKLVDGLGDRVVYNGHLERHLPHILHVSVLDVATETLLMNLDLAGIMAASGSACTSGSLEVSHVLEAMKLSELRKSTAVRFSFGLGNTIEQADIVSQQIATIAKRVRIKN
ncbi:cysteine desulfurase family protein [Paenibacillus popilliae]|uniref:cysteine desulfurase n=1 Tax=Paenibacillus popilliae ATCC 14706 TaxID=1212764 RepID=M9LLK6_PAEPP|nr:cysteine desulfurase family protein [Paenibacillus popilliae]GAC44195.1 cysteine sulfinate desulfinase/cysteine desulfurase [Paenibacillus popilliae ATCC 14706]